MRLLCIVCSRPRRLGCKLRRYNVQIMYFKSIGSKSSTRALSTYYYCFMFIYTYLNFKCNIRYYCALLNNNTAVI